MGTRDWRHDSEYISYIESGESAAVFVVRDIVKSIDTRGKWVDVISLSTYDKAGAEGRIAFNWIIVELFPRKLQPEYDSEDLEHNRYLTWVTAHEDINNQREAGYKGEKYIVLCNLYNSNKNKYTTHTIITKKWWEPQEAYRPVQVRQPIEPKWEYRIQAVRKVNSKQVNYIITNKKRLEEIIRQNGRPTLEIIGIH